jgi:threonine/homoserine/homoserine lactone efflux protein
LHNTNKYINKLFIIKRIIFMDTYLSLLGFIAVMVGTPGPANLLLTIGGVQFGLSRCLLFILGLIIGKLVLNIIIGLGLGVFVTNYPWINLALKFTSAAYMIWLSVTSWSIDPKAKVEKSGSSKFSFYKGLIVHPLNPKAWVMCLIAWTAFAPKLGTASEQLVIVCLSFILCQLVLHSAWCWVGEKLRYLPFNRQKTSRFLIVLTVIVIIWAVTVTT